MISGAKIDLPTIVILAAGKGHRYNQELANTPESPKCKSLLVISGKDNTNDTPLSLALTQLLDFGFTHFLIVGGFFYNELHQYLLQKFQPQLKSGVIKLIDANPDWIHGPAFSFSAIPLQYFNQDGCFVFPADTLFHPSLISELVKFLELTEALNYPTLFYGERNLEQKLSKGKSLHFQSPPSTTQTKNILKNFPFDITSIDSQEISISSTVIRKIDPKSNILFPVMYISFDFSKYIQKFRSLKMNSLIKLFESWAKGHEFALFQINAQNWGFWDIDENEDVEIAKKLYTELKRDR